MTSNTDQFLTPELQFLQNNNIMNSEEITNILECRKETITKMFNGTITFEKYHESLIFELSVFNKYVVNIENKMEIDDSKEMNAFNDLYNVFCNRLSYLYHNILVLFPINITSLSLVTDYMEFVKKYESFIIGRREMLNTFLSLIHKNVEVYKEMALFEQKYNNFEAARQFLEVGLKIHKNNKTLYTEDFLLAIQYLKNTNATSYISTSNKFKNILTLFKDDSELHFKLFDKVMELKNYDELQSLIMSMVSTTYNDNELWWHKLAILSLNGIIFKENKICYEKNCYLNIRRCVETYESGLLHDLSPDRKSRFWNFFLDQMIFIWKKYGFSKNNSIKNFVRDKMDSTFATAYQNGVLKEAVHYVYWVETTHKERDNILNHAIKINDNNVKVWIELLQMYVKHDCYEMATKVFDDGFNSLKEKSLPLWITMSLYLTKNNRSTTKMLRNYYIKGSYCNYTEISLKMRVKYLDWYKTCGDSDKVRILFNDLKSLEPECTDLYKIMINYELSTPNTNVNKVREYHAKVCKKCKNISSWIAYIKFEYEFGKPGEADFIFHKALKKMESLGVQKTTKLNEEYVQLKNKYMLKQ